MILNPKTCLVYTNIQTLGQRGLPGQATATEGQVQKKVLTLTTQYEQIFVVVTMGINGASIPRSHTDMVTSFTGFCSSLKDFAIATPIWVMNAIYSEPKGAGIMSWTWLLIVQHAFPLQDPSMQMGRQVVTFISDETLWEIFLRKAGMNPMAAQVVLSMLHTTDQKEKPGIMRSGLRLFVQLSAQERVDMFSELLGLKVIERINRVLDGQSI
jgi:hypothetical protein